MHGEDTAVEVDPIEGLARRMRRLPGASVRQLERTVAQLEEMKEMSRDGAERTQAYAAGPQAPPSPGLTEDNVEDAFRYHPWDANQSQQGLMVVEALVAAAKAILRHVPPSADRSAALRKLREARMDANSAITHRGRF